MPFKTGKTPAFAFSDRRLAAFIHALKVSGYEEHSGRKLKVRGEIATWRKIFATNNGNVRQNHVQITMTRDGIVSVFAHTEPYMGTSIKDLFVHGLAALLDDVSYPAGSRMLRADLRGRFEA